MLDSFFNSKAKKQKIVFLQQKMIYSEDLRNNPETLYVFGDNLERTGRGGQAKEMRGHVNAHGIVTKKRPSHGHWDDYFHDSDQSFKVILDKDFRELEKKLLSGSYHSVVFPSEGLGTGLAKLKVYAPNHLDYIVERINILKEKYS